MRIIRIHILLATLSLAQSLWALDEGVCGPFKRDFFETRFPDIFRASMVYQAEGIANAMAELTSLPNGLAIIDEIKTRRRAWQTRTTGYNFRFLNPLEDLPISLEPMWVVSDTEWNAYSPERYRQSQKEGVLKQSDFNALKEKFDRYMPVYRNIANVFSYPAVVHGELVKFWVRVQAKVVSGAQPNVELAMKAVLAETEAKVGFPEAVDLGIRKYSSEEWRAMLRHGKPFNDTAFIGGMGNEKSHWGLSHRMQWWIIAELVGQNPRLFFEEGPHIPIPELFKFLGEDGLTIRMRWPAGPNKGSYEQRGSIWRILFDNESEINASSPEWLGDGFSKGIAGVMY